MGADSAEGAIDAANILKPALSRGEVQVIGATTLAEYRRCIEKDAALERRFQPLRVSEPSCETTMEILQQLKPRYEAHHRISITPKALEAAVTLSHRYISGRQLPDKAIDLLDEAASRVRMEALALPPDLSQLEGRILQAFQEKEAAISSQQFEKAALLRNAEGDFRAQLETKRREQCPKPSADFVTEETVAQVLHQWTGIPVTRLTASQRDYLLHLEDALQERVSGQARAVAAISQAIRRGHSGLKDPKRPTGSFLALQGLAKQSFARRWRRCFSAVRRHFAALT